MLIFNTATDKTTFAAEMNQRRSDFGVAVVDDKIYAFGGFDLEVLLVFVLCLPCLEILRPAVRHAELSIYF